MHGDKPISDGFHLFGEGCGVFLGLVLRLFFGSPSYSVFAFISAEIGHIDDGSHLYLELVPVGDKLAVIFVVPGKD